MNDKIAAITHLTNIANEIRALRLLNNSPFSVEIDKLLRDMRSLNAELTDIINNQ